MQHTILIVDDETDFATICSMRLAHEGYKVLTAASGMEGLDLMRKEPPSLVLLDMHIPQMNGMEVCKNIKADETLKKVPVIFMTADGADIQAKVQACQAQGYILKPYEASYLLNKISEFVA